MDTSQPEPKLKKRRNPNPNTDKIRNRRLAPDAPGETKALTTRIRVDQFDRLAIEQEKRGVDRSVLIREALDLYIKSL